MFEPFASRPSRRDGSRDEERACRYLRRRGYQILARNFRCRAGEIDIIALHRGVLVFVEVKGRSSASHGAGFDAVTPEKRRRIVRAAQSYAASKGMSEARIRFDVISVSPGRFGARIRHDQNAFDADGR